MDVIFVNQFDEPKRRRLAHACSICRKRKKRCVHVGGADTPDNEASTATGPVEDEETPVPGRGKRQSLRISNLSSEQAQPQATPDEERPAQQADHARARFVSDLIPEATLLNRPAPAKGNARKPTYDNIGIWVDHNEWNSLVPPATDVATSSVNNGQKPHPTVIDPLLDIYFAKIHPILPLLDEQEFRRRHSNGKVPEALLHAICLIVAKDGEATPLLQLSSSTTPVSTREFCSAIHNSIRRALQPSNPTWDKITTIRILALTSLHTAGLEGAEEASILLSQAMHHAQTLGIHLGIQANAPAGKGAEMKRLFWCLWMLDRCNAATNGRPVIMSDIDIAIEHFTPRESGLPAFEAWLRIAQLLNKIIDFYRPTTDPDATGWEGDYPGLEEIIDEVGGWHLSSSLLATIHLFYLSVGILSHRTRGFREIPRGLGSSVRQRLCAIEIARLMTAETAPPLHPMPIIPYAVSLALSVSYQHLRQSQLEHQQADAREDFRTCCALLQNLRRTWCSADIMATLAEKVLDRLDRAPSLASYRIPRRFLQGEDGVASRVVETDVIAPPTACSHLDSGTNGLTANLDAVAGDENVPTTLEQTFTNGVDLFNNVDDVFGTFMDPNYPLNLDDMAFFDQFTPNDWNQELSAQR